MSEAGATERVLRPVTGIAYRIEEAAQLVGLSRATMFRLVKRGAVRVKREGKSVMVMHRDLEAYIESLPYDDRKAAQ